MTRIVSAIDIGSNSLKMVVGEGDGDAFKVLHEDRERLRLGRDVQREGVISAASTEEAVRTVKRFKEASDRLEAEEIAAVATAALRGAGNSREFIDAVERETAIRVRVLTPLEEARFIGISADAYFRDEADSILNIDVGGGSTELSLFERGASKKLYSMPIGAVNLTERHITADPPSRADLESLGREILTALREPAAGLADEEWKLSSATSGTSMHLVSLLNFEGSDGAPVIEIDRLSALSGMLTQLSLEQRANLPGIGRHRAEVLIAGAFILEGTMAALGIDVIKPCGYSLREGVVIDCLREGGAGSDR